MMILRKILFVGEKIWGIHDSPYSDGTWHVSVDSNILRYCSPNTRTKVPLNVEGYWVEFCYGRKNGRL